MQSAKQENYHTFFCSKLRNGFERGGGERWLRPESVADYTKPKNGLETIEQSHTSTHRSAQDLCNPKADNNPSRERGGGHGNLLLAAASWLRQLWERVSQFLQGCV